MGSERKSEKLRFHGVRLSAVVAALSMSAIAETEHARTEQLDKPESIYRACADIKLFNQEVLRVILLEHVLPPHLDH